MKKILCVLYDDPVHGYPKSYARDDIPRSRATTMDRLLRPLDTSTLFLASSQAALPVNSVYESTSKVQDINSS